MSKSGSAEQAIRKNVACWMEFIKAEDFDGIADLYASDAVAMPPNQPIVSGREAIRQFWRSTVQIPGLSLTFEPQSIEVAKSGGLAIDRGTYRLTGRPAGQSLSDSGKFIEVWRKVGDSWKVAANIYNSDKAAET